jgi:uncharacterized protein (DUF58 family)
MRPSILTRYLDPDLLTLLAQRELTPRDLIIGNLAGAHKSPLAGFAVEFTGHREYVPGDDPKHVDWRVYFNRDKYFVKQYELETNFVCHLVLDVSTSMRYGDGVEQKLFAAARAAMALAFGVLRQRDKVSLATFDDQLRYFIPPSHAFEQMLRMTDQIERTESRDKTSLATSLTELAGRLGRREIVMIFSDFFGDLEGLTSALQRLRFDYHEVILFHVLHDDELKFCFDGRARFTGLEGNDELHCDASEVRGAYLAAFTRFRSQLEQIAEAHRCEYVLLDTHISLGDSLVEYLNRRSSHLSSSRR